jgi:CRP-like cAMP-binding protein
VHDPFHLNSWTPILKVGIIPVHVDLENLPSGSRERFIDPQEHFFEDSSERRLYHKGEVVFARGDAGTEVFQVMRGVVRVEEDGGSGNGMKNSSLMKGPGQIFGEVSALDGRGRTATIVAHSQDVDVMVWDNAVVMDQLRASPERMHSLYLSLADRLRRILDGRSEQSSTALAARLLVGASGQRRRHGRRTFQHQSFCANAIVPRRCHAGQHR